MKTQKNIFVISMVFTGLSVIFGCSTAQYNSDSINWKELTVSQLQHEVESKSRYNQIWNYHGSSEAYHHFSRQPFAVSFTAGRYKYFKVSKEGNGLIQSSEEMAFAGVGIRSVAFSRQIRGTDKRRFNHILSRGLVKAPLVPEEFD